MKVGLLFMASFSTALFAFHGVILSGAVPARQSIHAAREYPTSR